jgi:carbamoyl-phosphate synthase large subunit
VFFSIKDSDKTPQLVETAQTLVDLGFFIVATRGTAAFLEGHGIACEVVNKVYEGRPNIVDMMKDGGIALVMNTTEGAQAVEDSRGIRSVALYDKIPYYTTAAASHAAAMAMKSRGEGALEVRALQG